MPGLVDPVRPSVPVQSGNVAQRFARGFGYPLRGLRFLARHRDLWPWAIAPALITIWMIIGALWVTWAVTPDLVHWVWPRPETGSTVLWWTVVYAVRIAVFAVSAVVLWVLGNMLASPFYDVMAEKTEKLLLDRSEQPFNLRVVLGDAWMSIRHSAAGLLLYVGIMVPTFALNLLPGLGSVVYTVLSTVASIFFLAREMMDIPLSRRRTPFRDKLRWMRGHKALLAGLGSAYMVMLMVPLVNLLVMPIAVMGGTLLFVHLEGEGAGVPHRGPTA